LENILAEKALFFPWQQFVSHSSLFSC